MIAIPARVSPPRSLPHSLPASPVLSAAPAVVIRQAAEPVATPAVTIHATPATAPRSPQHAHPHNPYATFYTPTAAVVATPAAVVHDPHLHHQQQQQSHAYAQRQHHRAAKVVDPHTHYMHDATPHYCEHHAPVSYKQLTVADTRAYAQPQLVYARPHSPASYHPTAHVVYQQPPTPTHYQLVYEASPAAVAHYPAAIAAPSHVCSHMDAAQYYASALLSVGMPQPSLSPPQKPQPTRPTPSVPTMALTSHTTSAFTPVQPIATYPRNGILIQ